jgi:hypothetical protein
MRSKPVPLTDLHANLTGAIATLDAIGAKLITPEGRALPSDSIKIFDAAVKQRASLEDAIKLLEVRIATKAVLDQLRLEMVRPTPVFRVHGVAVRFPIARLMLFQNVVCSNWALYDTIAPACARICATDKIVNDTKRSPNLLDFGEHENIGARTHRHVRAGYGWNLCLSYQIRNWVVHSGEVDSSLRLFEFSDPSTDGFKIHIDAWNALVNLTKAKFQLAVPDTSVLATLQADGAKSFLDACDEVDKLCSFLLGYSTGALRLQLEILCS